jgi:hypothetical protein
MIMPRMTASKSLELEKYWRGYLDGWRRRDLNQREYCELHGLPLKRFGNWRAPLRHEESASVGKPLYRRGAGRRRNFSEADKRRIVEETCCEGASVSGVAKRYGVGTRSLFSWATRISVPALIRRSRIGASAGATMRLLNQRPMEYLSLNR